MTKCPSNSAYVAHDTNNLLEHRPKSLHLVNGDSSEAPPPYIHATGDTEGRKKSVTFASNSPSPSTISFTSQQSPTSRAIPIPGNIKQNIRFYDIFRNVFCKLRPHKFSPLPDDMSFTHVK